jgi:hypothetical protein
MYKVIMSIFIIAFASLTALAAEKGDTLQNKDAIPSDTLAQINNLISEIEAELKNPSSSERISGSYLTFSQQTIRKKIIRFAQIGQNYLVPIDSLSVPNDTIILELVNIALGLMGNSKAHEKIRDIVRHETDPNFRGMAVRALSTYNDTLDVPLFFEAALDTHIVIVQNDYVRTDGSFHEAVNIVGIEAIPALAKLGYEVKPDSQNIGKYILKKNR